MTKAQIKRKRKPRHLRGEMLSKFEPNWNLEAQLRERRGIR